jgi:hypothetical protein
MSGRWKTDKEKLQAEAEDREASDRVWFNQTQIAKQTLRMTNAAALATVGPSKDESRRHLTSIGWTNDQIAKLESGGGMPRAKAWNRS